MVEALFAAFRILVAGTLFLAGLAKLADIRAAQRGVEAFGIPRTPALAIGALLPIVEVSLAVALVPTATAPWALVSASALFLAFASVVGVSLARGRRPDCTCFGNLWRGRIGLGTLGRNLALAGVAGMLAIRATSTGELCAIGCLDDPASLPLVVAGIVVGVVGAQWWLLLNLVAQNGRLLERMVTIESRMRLPDSEAAAPATSIGDPAPAFRLRGASGVVSLAQVLIPLQTTILIFTDPHCPACKSVVQHVARLGGETLSKVTLVLIVRGETLPDHAGSLSAEASVVFDPSGTVWNLYGVSGAPSAIAIDGTGRVKTLMALGYVEVMRLVSEAVADKPPSFPVLRDSSTRDAEVLGAATPRG